MRVYRVIQKDKWGEIASCYYTDLNDAEKDLERMRKHYPDARIVEEEIGENTGVFL